MPSILIEASPETGPVWWLPLIVGCLGLAAGTLALLAVGDRSRPLLRRPADALARLTGLPAWSAAGVVLALWALSVAFIGFTWDVAWHADLGRDQALFTPPHVMILVGLIGIGLAAVASIALASIDGAEVGLRAGRLRIPWSSLPMGFMALGAVVGFPLDDYWHATYGIDVTMWSPTHLLMIGGASLTPIAAWLMVAEAEVDPLGTRVMRRVNEVLAAATLLGLSTFQLEFDLGVPQWQALYQPVLMAVAMGVGLVAAREVLGRGGALRATAGFLVLRGGTALLVGPIFGLSTERFPLYIAGAVSVEVVYLLGARWSPAARVGASALAIGTVGLAAEWGWTQVWGLQPWQPRLLPSWWLVLAMSVVASLLGSLLGRAVARTPQLMRVSRAALVFVALAALLAVPFPRHAVDAVATVSATPAGPVVPAITREGVATFEQLVRVSVTVSPESAAADADVFRIAAWQGGRIVIRPLHAVGGGRYTTDDAIPTGGTWKSLVFLSKGDVVAATPVDFPHDATYGLDAIPAPLTAPRTSRFQPASTYLTRESHGGSALPAVLAYSALGLVAVIWFAALIGVGEAMGRQFRATLSTRRLLRGAR